MDDILFTAYVEKYSGMVYRVAFSYMKAPADSEDIMQEAFLRLYTTGKRFESEEHLKAWLIRVTINLAKNELKAFRRKDKALASADPEEPPAFYPELDEAMKSLNEDYRIAVYLYYYEGYGVRELASLLGISEANAKTRLKRARNKLKEFLTDDERS